MSDSGPVTLGLVVKTWWPLAASWLLMALELPAVSAIIARLPDPEIELAAYGGLAFPLAVLIEGPIIMLLAASTALCKDWTSYRQVHFFMMVSGLILTLVHVVVVFTPLFDIVARGIIGAPDEILPSGRLALMVMPLWTWAIAYRRFQQGVLIRFGHSGAVGLGTGIRLVATASILGTGYVLASFPGAVVGAAAVSGGVIVEAIYAGYRIRPVLRDQVQAIPDSGTKMPWGEFFAFYIPLALTPVLAILAQPVVAAALSRMPLPIESLAVWPVLYGLLFMLRCLGMAYNEVVVALLGRPGARKSLITFNTILAISTSSVLLLMAATPLSRLWFSQVAFLEDSLVELAEKGLWIVVFLPALAVLQSWFQANLLHVRRTRVISESVVALLTALCIVLFVGVQWGGTTGLFVGLVAYTCGGTVCVAWLFARSRGLEKTA